MLDLLFDCNDVLGGYASPCVSSSGLAECQFIVAHCPLDGNDGVRSNGCTFPCILYIYFLSVLSDKVIVMNELMVNGKQFLAKY